MSKPVRLHKQESDSWFNLLNYIEAWVLSHATLCLTLFIGVLILLFVIVCFAICGASAVESGTQYRMDAWI